MRICDCTRSWRLSDSSIQKMGNNLIKALAEAGYLDSPRRRNLQNVFPSTRCVATALHRLKAELLSILEGNV